jgi:hypothetical protein
VKRIVRQLKGNIGKYVEEDSPTAKVRCGGERSMGHLSVTSVQYIILGISLPLTR